MIRSMLLSALAVSMGMFSACGAPAGDVATAHQGVSGVRGENGVRRRVSVSREGYEADLAYFRQRLQELETAPGKEKLAAGISEIIARLEGLAVKPGDAALQSEGDLCGAYYSLTADVYPWFTYGGSDASASYVEFGPPSPWSKTLYTYAYAHGYSGSTLPPDSESHVGTFGGAGSFSVPTSSASTGMDFCQHLIGYSYFYANGCSGGFRSEYQEVRTCD